MDHNLRARTLLESHIGDADGMRLYSHQCQERQLSVASTPWANLVIVTMPPREFLSLAAPIYEEADLPEGSLACIVDGEKMAGIAHGLKGGLSNLPYLHLEPENGDARVTRHEGRHRALTAEAMGIQRFPVQLVMDEVDGHGVWHLMERLPRLLLGERPREGGPGNEANSVALPYVPVTAAALGLDPEYVEEAGRAARTVTRYLYGHEADALDCPVTRAWAEDQGMETLRWSEREERYDAALAHLVEAKTVGPRP